MTLLIRMAWLNIWRNKRRTSILLCAMIVGLVGILFTYGFIEGWLSGMVDVAVRSAGGHITIHGASYHQNPIVENGMDLPRDLAEALDGDARILGWSQRLVLPGLVSNARQSAPVRIVGIDPGGSGANVFLRECLREGSFLDDGEGNRILIGRSLAESFKTRLRQKVVLMSQHAEGDIASGAFRIAGIFDTGNRMADKATVYVSKSALQDMLGVGARISEVVVQAAGLDASETIARDLKRSMSDPSLVILDWRESMPFVAEVITLSRQVSIPMLSVFYVAMAFGILNTLLIAIGERAYETGVLLAIGMRPARVVALIVLEALCVATVASVAGGALGYGLVAWLHVAGIDLSALAAGMEYSGVGHVIYPSVGFGETATAVLATFAVALLSALLPALRAGRANPVEAMRRNR